MSILLWSATTLEGSSCSSSLPWSLSASSDRILVLQGIRSYRVPVSRRNAILNLQVNNLNLVIMNYGNVSVKKMEAS